MVFYVFEVQGVYFVLQDFELIRFFVGIVDLLEYLVQGGGGLQYLC